MNSLSWRGGERERERGGGGGFRPFSQLFPCHHGDGHPRTHAHTHVHAHTCMHGYSFNYAGESFTRTRTHIHTHTHAHAHTHDGGGLRSLTLSLAHHSVRSSAQTSLRRRVILTFLRQLHTTYYPAVVLCFHTHAHTHIHTHTHTPGPTRLGRRNPL